MLAWGALGWGGVFGCSRQEQVTVILCSGRHGPWWILSCVQMHSSRVSVVCVQHLSGGGGGAGEIAPTEVEVGAAPGPLAVHLPQSSRQTHGQQVLLQHVLWAGGHVLWWPQEEPLAFFQGAATFSWGTCFGQDMSRLSKTATVDM